MKKALITLLESIVEREATERSLQWERTTRFRLDAPGEQFHLVFSVRTSVGFLPMQMSIQVYDDIILCLIFPSPQIIKNAADAQRFLPLANEANRELYRGRAEGRFWVDFENMDFAYEVRLPALCDEERLSKQLFETPFHHLQDLALPLLMLSREEHPWDPDKAARWLHQLREDNFVDNREYGIY